MNTQIFSVCLESWQSSRTTTGYESTVPVLTSSGYHVNLFIEDKVGTGSVALAHLHGAFIPSVPLICWSHGAQNLRHKGVEALGLPSRCCP